MAKKKKRSICCFGIGERSSVLDLLDEQVRKLEVELEPHVRQGWSSGAMSPEESADAELLFGCPPVTTYAAVNQGWFRGAPCHLPGIGRWMEIKKKRWIISPVPDQFRALQNLYELKKAYLDADIDRVFELAWNAGDLINEIRSLKTYSMRPWQLGAEKSQREKSRSEIEVKARKAQSDKAAERRQWVLTKANEIDKLGNMPQKKLRALIYDEFRIAYPREKFSIGTIKNLLATHRPKRGKKVRHELSRV